MTKTFKMSYLDWTALALVVVGALNWGLVGLAGFLTDGVSWNLVNILFGSVAAVEFGVYLLVGLAGLYAIYFGYRIATSGTVEPTEPEMTEPEPSERRTA